MESKAVQGVTSLGRALQRAGPYVLIEVLLPGGTLIALILFLYRRGPAQVRADVMRLSAGVGRALDEAIAAWATALRRRYDALLGPGARERDGLEPLGFALD